MSGLYIKGMKMPEPGTVLDVKVYSDGLVTVWDKKIGWLHHHAIPIPDVVERPRWIPVTERLPEKRKANYLCYLDDDSIAVCCWSNVSLRGCVWEWHNPNWKEVTHWMPLPEPPKENGKSET